MHRLSVDQLIDHEHHAWNEILELLQGSRNNPVVLKATREDGEKTLYLLQISTKSYMGAVVLEAGAILWDNGWVVLLGAGHPEVSGSLTAWNGLEESDFHSVDGMLVVAYDAAGGFFALDTGKFGGSGLIYYWAPDNLEWESTELRYSGFLSWLAEGDLDQFYETFRWKDWRGDMAQLAGGQVFAYYPPLWTSEGSGDTSSKTPISIREAWHLAVDSDGNGGGV
jgi:hypothetical protein